MHVEYITGIGFAPGRLTRQQRDLAMGGSVLCQIVNHDQRVLAAITEIFRHGETGKRRDPLQPGGACRTGSHYDAALRGSVFLDRIDGAPDARTLLPNRDIDTDDVAGLLVDNRIYRDRRLADGTIADDQFALATAEREQGINDDEPGLNRLDHEIPIDDRWRRTLDRLLCVGRDRAHPVEWPAERIDDTTEHRRPHWNAHHVSRAPHHVTGLNRIDIVQQNATDATAFEHLGEAELSFAEVQQLIEPDVGQPGDKRNAVSHLFDPTDLFRLRAKHRAAQFRPGLCEPRIRFGFRAGCHS